MNKDVEVEARPRPLSAGLWTLFSWLRRDDRSSSSESLSSAGSDRTVASFAFLAPDHYRIAPDPLILPPPGPPTDSYKKRVHDRNLRRQYDRDLTLHRKYGLFKSETCGYDAFSLPPVRRVNVDCNNKWDRERRATSECLQRRVVHVPGKRRAPAPPVVGSSASLPRRHTRKRPAPQPPPKLIEINKENLETINKILTQMNVAPGSDKQKLGQSDVMMGCKSEKYCKKETVKDGKIRSEKSFLKQIFDNKKRNSAIDTSSVKLLPSISELDKQAAEIIETCKTKPSERDNNVKNVLAGKMDTGNLDQTGTWICVSCLRKYNSSLVTCLYCLPKTQLQKTQPIDDKNVPPKGSNSSTQTEKHFNNIASSSKNSASEEKQKLKEMLKEMKDSLHRTPKPDLTEPKIVAATSKQTYTFTETPTLKVGSKVHQEIKPQLPPESTSSAVTKISARQPVVSTHKQYPVLTESPLVTQQTVIAHHANIKSDNSKMLNKNTTCKTSSAIVSDGQTKRDKPELVKKEIKDSSSKPVERSNLHIPLKISSLLNPVYVPKESISHKSSQDIVMPTHKPTQTSTTHQIVQPIDKPQNSKIEVLTSKNLNKIAPTSSNSTPSSAPSSSQANTTPGEMQVKIDTKEIASHKNNTPPTQFTVAAIDSPKPQSKVNIRKNIVSVTPSSAGCKLNNTQDQHSKRRDLIHQLEQSIAKGDERAAADAAAKLAQLRLSCSVLSFSSQILSPASTSLKDVNAIKSDNKPTTTPTNHDEPNQIHQTKNIKTQDPSIVLEKSTQSQQVMGPRLDIHKNSAIPEAPKTTKVTHNEKDSGKEKAKVVQEAATSQHNRSDNQNNVISIAVLVEDREATRGPVYLRINRQANMRDLRREAETSLGLATNLQRWIIGRTLCTEDNIAVASLAGPDFSAPFYLCLVESETKINSIPRTKVIDTTKITAKHTQDKGGNVYTELVQLEQQALVPNSENFECGVCMEEYAPGRGVVLRECVHIFCKECLSDVVRHCEEPNVSCPAMGCRGVLQEREIRAMVPPKDYERWLARGLAAAESGTRNAFHCRTTDCTGWALCEPGVQRFPCPVCNRINCVPCQDIHEGVTCEQHQAKIKEAAKSTDLNQADEGTRTLLNSLISKGEALECPECKAIITKKWGCDWVKCSACKTEICWVTRGRRWGPGGRGDTSGGCRCGVDGKRCHPSCGYCH